MQLSYDYAKDRALICLRANYESHLRIPMSGRAEYGKYIMDINIMKKHLFRPILIACDTIITRVQDPVGCHV